jgi:two-component system chemotaxis response regulator CheY
MKATLLVTDDSMIIREMIKEVARRADWEVVAEAINGLEAVQMYEHHRPDAVTLDLTMPEYDGLYALRGIRQLNPEAQVLVVSAIDQTPVIKEAIDLGAADFIVKPFDESRLLRALQIFAQRREAVVRTASC